MSKLMKVFSRREFVRVAGGALGLAGLGIGGAAPAEAFTLGRHRLPRSSPEEQGVSSAALLEFLDAVEHSRHEFHSFMLVRHGSVVAEGWWKPYGANRNHMLYSLSKSFTSTAVGLAVSEGRLSIEDEVISFFPDKLPEEISAHLRALRVKHLLTMSVGQAEDSTPHLRKEQDWVKTFLALPITHEPGTHFLYNSGATYMLSAIVQHVTGERVIDFLRPRLFEPLGISGETWEVSPQGINTGGWGLSVTTEALAKFGQLYLRNGRWKSQQVIPEAWVHEATTFKIQQPASGKQSLSELKKTSDWHQGYCYQFWRCRHNAFRGDGAYGQFMIVMPEQDAVVAITCETHDMQGELNLVWEHVWTAMHESSLPPDAGTDRKLAERLGKLALWPPHGNAWSETKAKVSGKTYRLEPNRLGLETVEFEFAPDRSAITAWDGKHRYRILCGVEKWIEGVTDLPGTPPRLTSGELRPCKVAASGTWSDDSTFLMRWQFYETPHHDMVTCLFAGETVRIEIMSSLEAMAANPKPGMVLRGRII